MWNLSVILITCLVNLYRLDDKTVPILRYTCMTYSKSNAMSNFKAVGCVINHDFRSLYFLSEFYLLHFTLHCLLLASDLQNLLEKGIRNNFIIYLVSEKKIPSHHTRKKAQVHSMLL